MNRANNEKYAAAPQVASSQAAAEQKPDARSSEASPQKRNQKLSKDQDSTTNPAKFEQEFDGDLEHQSWVSQHLFDDSSGY